MPRHAVALQRHVQPSSRIRRGAREAEDPHVAAALRGLQLCRQRVESGGPGADRTWQPAPVHGPRVSRVQVGPSGRALQIHRAQPAATRLGCPGRGQRRSHRAEHQPGGAWPAGRAGGAPPARRRRLPDAPRRRLQPVQGRREPGRHPLALPHLGIAQTGGSTLRLGRPVAWLVHAWTSFASPPWHA